MNYFSKRTKYNCKKDDRKRHIQHLPSQNLFNVLHDFNPSSEKSGRWNKWGNSLFCFEFDLSLDVHSSFP